MQRIQLVGTLQWVGRVSLQCLSHPRHRAGWSGSAVTALHLTSVTALHVICACRSSLILNSAALREGIRCYLSSLDIVAYLYVFLRDKEPVSHFYPWKERNKHVVLTHQVPPSLLLPSGTTGFLLDFLSPVLFYNCTNFISRWRLFKCSLS